MKNNQSFSALAKLAKLAWAISWYISSSIFIEITSTWPTHSPLYSGIPLSAGGRAVKTHSAPNAIHFSQSARFHQPASRHRNVPEVARDSDAHQVYVFRRLVRVSRRPARRQRYSKKEIQHTQHLVCVLNLSLVLSKQATQGSDVFCFFLSV